MNRSAAAVLTSIWLFAIIRVASYPYVWTKVPNAAMLVSLVSVGLISYAIMHLEERVIRAYKRFIKKNPTNADAYFELGRAYADLDRDTYTEEVSAYLQAIEVDPNHVEARFWLAVAYDKGGHTDLAVKQARMLMSLAPERAEELLKTLNIGQQRTEGITKEL